MANIEFNQLLTLYRATTFNRSGNEGVLLVSSQEITDIIRLIEADDSAAADANFTVLEDPNTIKVGQNVTVQVGPPRTALGYFVKDFDGLLNTPDARVSEPHAYFVVDGGITRDIDPCPTLLSNYRRILGFTKLVIEAAAYLDQSKKELIFIKDGKFIIPIRYTAADLSRVILSDCDAILKSFSDNIHHDQKLAILAEVTVGICASQSAAGRFRHLIANLASVDEEIRNGYKLFASSFSYTKIRNDIESARVDYLNKIHKTVIDIQTQLLGIPVATVIVASQLKLVSSCASEFWGNFSVVVGAWIFVVLLAIAIGNQWATLNSISSDIARQKAKFEREFAAISEQFSDIFIALDGRIFWQRSFLLFFGILALSGACVATFVAYRVTNVSFKACLYGEAVASSINASPAPPHDAAKPNQTPSALPPSTPFNQPKAVLPPGSPQKPSLDLLR